jgi:DNA-binding FadR family transcriptional regulator
MARKMSRNQIVAFIEAKIVSREWPPGSKLPTTEKLVAYFGKPKSTIDVVIEILRARDLITGVQGGRRYVTGASPEEVTIQLPPEEWHEDQP